LRGRLDVSVSSSFIRVGDSREHHDALLERPHKGYPMLSIEGGGEGGTGGRGNLGLDQGDSYTSEKRGGIRNFFNAACSHGLEEKKDIWRKKEKSRQGKKKRPSVLRDELLTLRRKRKLETVSKTGVSGKGSEGQQKKGGSAHRQGAKRRNAHNRRCLKPRKEHLFDPEGKLEGGPGGLQGKRYGGKVAEIVAATCRIIPSRLSYHTIESRNRGRRSREETGREGGSTPSINL